MLPVEDHAVSRCWPVNHWARKECWDGPTKQGKRRCCVCRQYEVGEEQLYAVGALTNTDLVGLWNWADFPPDAQKLLRQYQTGEKRSRDLWQMVDDMEYQKSRENSPRKRLRSVAQRIITLQDRASSFVQMAENMRIQAQEVQRETEEILAEARRQIEELEVEG